MIGKTSNEFELSLVREAVDACRAGLPGEFKSKSAPQEQTQVLVVFTIFYKVFDWYDLISRKLQYTAPPLYRGVPLKVKSDRFSPKTSYLT